MGVQIFCDRTICPAQTTTFTWRKYIAAGEVIASHGFLPHTCSKAHKWSYLVRATKTHVLVRPFTPILYTGCNQYSMSSSACPCQPMRVPTLSSHARQASRVSGQKYTK